MHVTTTAQPLPIALQVLYLVIVIMKPTSRTAYVAFILGLLFVQVRDCRHAEHIFFHSAMLRSCYTYLTVKAHGINGLECDMQLHQLPAQGQCVSFDAVQM